MIVLLPLHTSVLEPNLDLSFGERQGVGNLDATTTGQIAIIVELFLEFECLEPRVGLTSSLRFVAEID